MDNRIVKNTPKTFDDDSLSLELRETSAKLLAIARLIETQVDGDAMPLNNDEFNFGLGLLISECASRVRIAADRIEEKDLRS